MSYRGKQNELGTLWFLTKKNQRVLFILQGGNDERHTC